VQAGQNKSCPCRSGLCRARALSFKQQRERHLHLTNDHPSRASTTTSAPLQAAPGRDGSSGPVGEEDEESAAVAESRGSVWA